MSLPTARATAAEAPFAAPDDPAEALEALARALTAEPGSLADAVVADRDPDPPGLGLLAAAGPRAAAAPGAYALLVEAIREGHLCHHGRPRILALADSDLALLAGDYLYARGLETLAGLGDLPAITVLSELISTAATLAVRPAPEAGTVLWPAAALAVTLGADAEYELAVAALRDGSDPDGARLSAATARRAERSGLERPLARAAEAVGSRSFPDG